MAQEKRRKAAVGYGLAKHWPCSMQWPAGSSTASSSAWVLHAFRGKEGPDSVWRPGGDAIYKNLISEKRENRQAPDVIGEVELPIWNSRS